MTTKKKNKKKKNLCAGYMIGVYENGARWGFEPWDRWRWKHVALWTHAYWTAANISGVGAIRDTDR